MRGPRDFSRGIRTQFSRTEGSGAPCSGVAVSSSGGLCCPEIFSGASRFFPFGIPIGRSRAGQPFLASEVSFGEPVRAGPGCLAACRRPRRGRRRRGSGYMVYPSEPGKFFRRFGSFFQSYPQLVDNSVGFLLIGVVQNDRPVPVSWVAGSLTRLLFKQGRAPAFSAYSGCGTMLLAASRVAELSMNQAPRGSRTKKTSAPVASRAR